MPGIAYRDPEILQREFARVFGRNWISIGFGQQIKSPGHVLPVTVAGNPLILLRDGEGRVRVFHNVCRHRGLQIIAAPPAEPLKSITCPYHAWTYGLDGSCLSAPYWHRKDRKPLHPKPEDGFGLIEVRTKVWMDVVFVDLSGAALPFESAIEPLQKRWNVSAIPPLWMVTLWEAEVPANWKLVVENFLDYYHLSVVHSQLGPVEASIPHEVYKLSNDLIGIRTSGAAVNKPRSGPIPVVPQLKAVLGEDDETYSLFPNTLLFIHPSFFTARTLIPRDAGTTYVQNAVYVHESAGEERFAGERERLTKSVHLVNQQDMDILAKLQATRASPVADRCRLAPEWDVMSHLFQIRAAEALVEA